MNPERIKKGFPQGIDFPEPLKQLCEWHELNGDPISGRFSLAADEDRQAIYWWFRTNAVSDRFGVFGSDPDGSIYAVWRQDDGRQPIVYLGSEGQPCIVLAGDMLEFLRLLAIGYCEIVWANLSAPPKQDEVNVGFQQWVEQTFNVFIPHVGIEITEPAQRLYDDFSVWCDQVDEE